MPYSFGFTEKPPDLLEAFAKLRAYQELVVCLWPDSPIIPLLPTGADYAGMAIDFWDRSTTVDLDELAVIPSRCHLRKIDKELWFDAIQIHFAAQHRLQRTVARLPPLSHSVDRLAERSLPH